MPKINELFSLGSITQCAYLVDDVQASVRYFAEQQHIGPFIVFDDPEFTTYDYMGEPIDLKMSAAIAYSGRMQIEFIKQTNAVRSIFNCTPFGGTLGFHHFAVRTEDFGRAAAEIAESGGQRLQGGQSLDGSRIGYFTGGLFQDKLVEVLQFSEEMAAMFDRLQAAARDWDGRDPIFRF